MLSHFSLQNGVICCKVPQSKSDQDGEHAFEKHIFANPLQPMYCAVLALAMRVWTMRLEDGGREGMPNTCLVILIGRCSDFERHRYDDLLAALLLWRLALKVWSSRKK